MAANLSIRSTRAVLGIAILATVLAIVLRIVLSLGRVATICNDESVLLKFVVLVLDFVAIVILPIVAVFRISLKDTHVTPRTAVLAGLIPLAAFAIYELVRNPCIAPFLGR